jgi:PPK2 family polyphosphate:nucleotide phosphotransferase
MAKPKTLQPVEPGKKFRLADHDPDGKPPGLDNRADRMAELEKLSSALNKLQDVFYGARSHKLLLVLQGMDTAGKDGTIRHVFSTVDPLGVRVASFKAPTDIERDHDYLWRVHTQVPAKGEIVIFNRSHYEEVLITRVHKWIDAAECKRRYAHINAFEQMLVETGTVIIKCFLNISSDEQRERLQARTTDPTKQWKFNSGDLAERKLWPEYQKAYESAIAATSTPWAPWYVVPANSKSSRSVFVAQLLVATMEDLDLKYPPGPPGIEKIQIE